MLEKKIWGKHLEKTKVFKYIYTLFFVVISFTIFNSNSLNEVINSLKNMFFLNKIELINTETIYSVSWGRYKVLFKIKFKIGEVKYQKLNNSNQVDELFNFCCK